MKKLILVAFVCLSGCKPAEKEVPSVPSPAQPAQAPSTTQHSADAGAPAVPAPSPATPETASAYPLRWTAELGLPSLAELPSQLSAAGGIYGELSRGDKTDVPKSCSDWARLHAEGYEPSTTLEVQPDIAAKSRCDALKLLQRAKPANRSFVRELKLTPKVVSVLPAAIASGLSPDEQAKLADSHAEKRSIKEHDPRLHATVGAIPDSLEIKEGGGQSFVLIEPLAWGDFDGDGVDDILVSVTNGASEGSLLSSRVMALTRSDAQSVLRVVDGL